MARSDIRASVFGLGGVDWPSDVERLEPVIAGLGLGGPRVIVNDAFVALRAGTDGPAGVVVVAGSGSTVAARNRAGETYRTLGQSPPLFDDFGSANDVSAQAVQAVARAFTGRGPKTTLTQRLCEATSCAGAAELLEGLTRGSIAVPQTAAVVLAEAEGGDCVAHDIVTKVGRALGTSAAVAIRRLGMEDEQLDVVLAGGLFRGLNDVLWNAIYEPVHRAAPTAVIIRLEAPPVVGAGLLALDLVHAEATHEVRVRLSEACSRALSRTAEGGYDASQ